MTLGSQVLLITTNGLKTLIEMGPLETSQQHPKRPSPSCTTIFISVVQARGESNDQQLSNVIVTPLSSAEYGACYTIATHLPVGDAILLKK